jgi:hypothetical protein
MTSDRKAIGLALERHIRKHARPDFSCFVCRGRDFRFLGLSMADPVVRKFPELKRHNDWMNDEMELKLACERCGWMISFWAPAVTDMRGLRGIAEEIVVKVGQ